MDKNYKIQPPGRTPTTLEMDGIYTKEDELHKDDIYIQCTSCWEWSFTNINKLSELKCACGAVRKWNYRELTSFRTYDPIRLKKRKKK